MTSTVDKALTWLHDNPAYLRPPSSQVPWGSSTSPFSTSHPKTRPQFHAEYSKPTLPKSVKLPPRKVQKVQAAAPQKHHKPQKRFPQAIPSTSQQFQPTNQSTAQKRHSSYFPKTTRETEKTTGPHSPSTPHHHPFRPTGPRPTLLISPFSFHPTHSTHLPIPPPETNSLTTPLPTPQYTALQFIHTLLPPISAN